MNSRKLIKRSAWALLFVFLLANVIAFNQAWRFTHFSAAAEIKTKAPDQLSFRDKIKALFLGVSNPRPENKVAPDQKFETLFISSDVKLECWSISAENPAGTVILFHGYSGCKSMMLDKAAGFLKMNYNTLLVDFRGSGGSEGNQTTVGFEEAEDVKACCRYLVQKGEQRIFLFGTSMGAAAILKCMQDTTLKPAGLILECPFGSLYETTVARFHSMHLPVFPMAALLDFWGGAQHGFWAFSHSPRTYARHVTTPVLLLWGGRDEKVSREEINDIYANLKGRKKLDIFPLAGHEDYLLRYKKEWADEVGDFLKFTEASGS